MRIWVLSDIHVELTRGWDLPRPDERPDYDVLVVAGDLVPRMERGVAWLRERVVDRPVVYVAGNHESYGVDVDRTLEKARAAAEGSNVHVLENETVRIAGTTFAGATLWTDFDLFGDPGRAMLAVGETMNDFKKIRTSRYAERFRPRHALARHKASRAFLEEEMRRPRSGALVVVTHHAPRPGVSLPSSPSWEDQVETAYASDLRALLAPGWGEGGRMRPADLWIHGHTHETVDIVVGGTRVVSNAKGYGPWSPQDAPCNPRFDQNLVVTVGAGSTP